MLVRKATSDLLAHSDSATRWKFFQRFELLVVDNIVLKYYFSFVLSTWWLRRNSLIFRAAFICLSGSGYNSLTGIDNGVGSITWTANICGVRPLESVVEILHKV